MAPEKCPQKSEQMTQASGVSIEQVLRVHDTEPHGAGSFCSELCCVHPSPTKAGIQQLGVELLFTPGFCWNLAAGWLCFWHASRALSLP